MVDSCSCLFVLFIWLRVSSVNADSWSATVPTSVVGLAGSCAVIPCMFNYPGKTAGKMTGIWYTESHDDMIYHTETSKISSHFKGRTSLLGALHDKNCTLKISPLKSSDKGPFMFRIEIEGFNKYTYKDNKVSITVQDSPEQPIISVAAEVASGKQVTASCAVSHSCPSDPPRITWSHSGTQTDSQSQLQEHGQWKLTSSLKFTPSREDHNKPLKCSAEFKGAKTAWNTKPLKVKYPPYNVSVITKLTVKENASVELTCSSDSNPLASSYQWFNIKGTLLATGHKYTLKSVSRHTEAFYCTANNTEGSNSSSLQKINVLYSPYNVNVVAKSTVRENLSVELTCSSDSNPPANNHLWFSLNGTLLAVGRMYTLKRVSRLTGAIYCTANNTEGRNSSSPQKINVLYPPEIKSESSCTSGISSGIFCVCIVDSYPPSEVKWSEPDSSRAFPNSSIERKGSLTTVTLKGWLGFPKTLHCLASNSEGNSSKAFQMHHIGLIILSLAVLAVVVILMAILVCVARRCCGARAAQQPVMIMKNEQNEMKATPKSSESCKEENCSDQEIYTNYQVDQNVYDNWGCDVEQPACENIMEDEAVYANV